jgi:hypothetical protein
MTLTVSLRAGQKSASRSSTKVRIFVLLLPESLKSAFLNPHHS